MKKDNLEVLLVVCSIMVLILIINCFFIGDRFNKIEQEISTMPHQEKSEENSNILAVKYHIEVEPYKSVYNLTEYEDMLEPINKNCYLGKFREDNYTIYLIFNRTCMKLDPIINFERGSQ